MKKTHGDKPVTIADLGQMLLKYFSPIYKELAQHSKDIGEIKKNQICQGDDIDEIKRIQLRMEQNIGKKVESLYDKADLHDQKLRGHEKRITKLESSN